MQSWPRFVEKQKEILMRTKDKVCLPLVNKLSPKISPDTLTYSRILMAFGLYFLLVIKIRYLFLWLVILYLMAKFTDMIDGCLARIRNQTSLWGEFIDVLADKIFYLIGFLVLFSLWPEIIASRFIFLVIAVAVIILIFDNLQVLLRKRIRGKVRMFRRLFEGIGYLIAIILLIVQLAME